MVRKIASVLIVICFLYVFSFFFVVAAPIEILKIDCASSPDSEKDYIHMIYTVYNPFFILMNSSDSARDIFFKIASFINEDFENFAILFHAQGIYGYGM